MDELEEYAENLRAAQAGAPQRRQGGCGCAGWGVAAIVFLLVAGGAVHIWTPILYVLIFLILAGMGITLFVTAVRRRGSTRGQFDPRNVDWHPLAVIRSARRESLAQAAMRRTRPSAATSPDPPAPAPPAALPADPAVTAAGAALADLPLPPEPDPDDAEPAAAGMPYLPEAPQAPDAPEAPDWA